MATKEKNHAIDNAKAHLESIRDVMERFTAACENYNQADTGTLDPTEAIEEEIGEMPLSVLVRNGWYVPGADRRKETPCEFEILLSTGGPALRIIGDLHESGQPENARMQWQDWGTPWTDLHGSDLPEGMEPSQYDELLLRFASRFYFGD